MRSRLALILILAVFTRAHAEPEPLPASAWTEDLWIGLDDHPERQGSDAPSFRDAHWIATQKNVHQSPKGPSVLGTAFSLPRNTPIESARLIITADDRFEIAINDHIITGGGNWRYAELHDLSAFLHEGRNTLRVRVTNDNPGPAGLLLRLDIKLASGETHTITSGEGWTIGADDHDWQTAGRGEPDAFVIASWGGQPWQDGVRLPPALAMKPPAYLRHEFTLDKPVKSATLHVADLGFADVHINGNRITDRFVSEWTDYNKRVYSRTYDAFPEFLSNDDELFWGNYNKGRNAISITLADGWYSGYLGYGHGREHYGKSPRVAAILELTHTDGTTTTITTGKDWKGSTGPIRAADMFMGETIDNTITTTSGIHSHWPDDVAHPHLGKGYDGDLSRVKFNDVYFGSTNPYFDDSDWLPVSVGLPESRPIVEPSPTVPIDAFHEFTPVSITEPTPGVYIADFGQNFAGVVRLTVFGKTGQCITVRHGERLNPDGTLYTDNLRFAKATDTFICRGDEEETFEPRFTFHGFQYAEFTGLPRKPMRSDITGIAIGSLTPRVGSFDCSSELLNQLASNVYWTQRANFISVPTDCPQRDERLGWMGDAQVYIRTAGLVCDVHAFMRKWLVDVIDATDANGNPPKFAPVIQADGGGDGGPAWADAATIVPWALYEMYNDTDILARQYDNMKGYVDFQTARATDDRLPPANFHAFGDWLDVQDPTPKQIIFMAYWAESTRIVANSAKILGKSDDAENYAKLRDEIIEAFNSSYIDGNGRIDGDSQTAYVLALRYGLVSGKRYDQAAQRLIELIEERDWHLSTGFIGTKDLMLVLAQIGRNDVAYRLIMNTTYPSWGFTIEHGATSIWERWDGWTPDNGFQSVGMNSFAHYSFGAVYQWMVENIGGIQLVEPGYSSFRIAPTPGGGLTHATVGLDTQHGHIGSHWEIDSGTITMRVEVPTGTTCTVIIPTSRPDSIVIEGWPPIDSNEWTVGPGRYTITASLDHDSQ